MDTEYVLSYTGSEIEEKLGMVDQLSEDINGKLDADKLDVAIDNALAQAKASGEFDGENGYTPIRGTDYWTTEDKASIIDAVLASIEGTFWGEVDNENHIVLSGVLAGGTYTIKYEDAEGGTTEIGTLTIGSGTSGEPSLNYTNLFNPTAATLNQRWSNSSYSFTTSSGAGYVVTDYIAVPTISSDENNPTILRFRGGSWAGNASIIYYDSKKAVVQATNMSDGYGVGAQPSKESASTDDNGDTYVRLGYRGTLDTKWTDGATAYIRVTLQINSTSTEITADDIQNVVITIDEPITD